jgi:hypothetical protein
MQREKERKRAGDEEQVHTKRAVAHDRGGARRQLRHLLAGVHKHDPEQSEPAKRVDELEMALSSAFVCQ